MLLELDLEVLFDFVLFIFLVLFKEVQIEFIDFLLSLFLEFQAFKLFKVIIRKILLGISANPPQQCVLVPLYHDCAK